MKKLFPVLLVALVSTVPGLALASGLDSGTQAANDFKTWFFAFCGVLALIYLGWQFLQLMGHKIQWIDFGESIAKVAVGGSVLGLGAWAWSVFA